MRPALQTSWSGKKVYEAFRKALIAGRLVRATGRIERDGPVVPLIAERIEDMCTFYRRWEGPRLSRQMMVVRMKQSEPLAAALDLIVIRESRQRCCFRAGIFIENDLSQGHGED